MALVCLRRLFGPGRTHQPGHEAIGQPGLGQNGLRRKLVDRVSKRGMQGDVNHRQSEGRQKVVARPHVKHHRKIVHAAKLGQQFGVSRVVVSCSMHRLLLQRRGGDGIDLALQSQTRGQYHGIVSRLAGPGVERAGDHVEHVR